MSTSDLVTGFADAEKLQELANELLRSLDGTGRASAALDVPLASGQSHASPHGIAVPSSSLPSGTPAQSAAPSYTAAVPAASPVLPHTAPQLPFDASAPAFYFLGSDFGRGPINGKAPQQVPGQGIAAAQTGGLDVNLVRQDFPILQERVNGKQLVWFDNAATTQKPRAVIDRLSEFYKHENSNIHRAAHELARRATDAYEGARETVRRFLGARSTNEIIFVRGTTEAINLISQSWGRQNIGEGDEIIVSHLEHHANIVPWQMLCAEKKARLRVIPVDDDGQLIIEEYTKLLSPRTKLVAVTQVSNALGTVVPVKQIIDLAHAAGALAMIDGAQSVSHMPVNVEALGTDFFVFSGHKIFGPTGIGVVYGKEAILNDMPPWQGGGNMIADVTFEKTQYHKAPTRFEAGTGNIADAVGLGAALDYVMRLGLPAIAAYEHFLLDYATARIKDIKGLKLIGTAADKASVLSFVLDGFTTEQVGQAFNKEGIAVRTGHHCAQPILRRFGLEATVRPSLAFYNTCTEVDHMIRVLEKLTAPRQVAGVDKVSYNILGQGVF